MSTNIKKTTINELKRLKKVSGGGVEVGDINSYGNVKIVDNSQSNQTDNSTTSSNINNKTTKAKFSLFSF